MTKDKGTSLLSNPVIVAAIIGLCGTIVTAALASPIVLELVREKQSTPAPHATATLSETDVPVPTSTEMPISTPTDTETPSFNPTSTFTSTATLTATPVYADLQIVAISDPSCVRDHRYTPTKYYVQHTISVRNIGAGSTNDFGTFSIHITLDTGGHRYSLEEWATRFNGVVGNLDLDFSNLGPNQDADTTVNIDLRGLTKYALEAIANSGTHTIPESNTTNNILIKSFTITNCP